MSILTYHSLFTIDPPLGQWSKPKVTSYLNIFSQEHLTLFYTDVSPVLSLALSINLGFLPPSTSLEGLSSSCLSAMLIGLSSLSVPSLYDYSQPEHTDDK